MVLCKNIIYLVAFKCSELSCKGTFHDSKAPDTNGGTSLLTDFSATPSRPKNDRFPAVEKPLFLGWGGRENRQEQGAMPGMSIAARSVAQRGQMIIHVELLSTRYTLSSRLPSTSPPHNGQADKIPATTREAV